MSENERVEPLRSEIDYDALIEKASPALKLYIGKLEQENSRLRQEVLELRQLVTRRQRAETAPRRARKPRQSPWLPSDTLTTSW